MKDMGNEIRKVATDFFTPSPTKPAKEGQAAANPAPAVVLAKNAPFNGEAKTKRVQLVFRPSTYNLAQRLAAEQGLSLNEYLHQLIETKR